MPKPKRKPPAPELSPAEKILEGDFANLLKKVEEGRTLTAAERALVQFRSLKPAPSPELDAPPPYVTDKTELAEILRVTRRTIQNWEKLEGAPEPDAAGRHDVAAWMRFRKEKGLKDANEEEAEVSERARQILLRNDYLETELNILKKAHTPNEVFLEQLNRLATDLTSLLRQKLENEFPLLAQGKTIPELRQLGKGLVDDIFGRVQRLADTWTI